MVQRRQHRVCLVTTNDRAIALPDRRRDMSSVGSKRTRPGNSEMNAIFEELALKGWILEPISGTKMRAIGPANEGPVYLSMRAIGREVQNQRRNLRQSGFVFDGDAATDIEEPDEVPARSQMNGAQPKGLILPHDFPPALKEMFKALQSTIADELEAARGANAEKAEWEQLYQEELNKNSKLEQERDDALARAQRAERRWQQFQELLRD